MTYKEACDRLEVMLDKLGKLANTPGVTDAQLQVIEKEVNRLGKVIEMLKKDSK